MAQAANEFLAGGWNASEDMEALQAAADGVKEAVVAKAKENKQKDFECYEAKEGGQQVRISPITPSLDHLRIIIVCRSWQE